MNIWKRRAAAAIAGLLPLTAVAGCGDLSKFNPDGPHQLVILFETWDFNYAPLPDILIAVTGTSLDKNGNFGKWFNPEAPDPADPSKLGAWVPYPMKAAVRTPFSHGQTVLPGEAAITEITGVFLGKIGQYLTCSVFVDGEVVTTETKEDRIEAYDGQVDPEKSGQIGGSAVVTCAYTLSIPGGN